MKSEEMTKHSNVVNFQDYKRMKRIDAVSAAQPVVDIDAWYHSTEIESDKGKNIRK